MRLIQFNFSPGFSVQQGPNLWRCEMMACFFNGNTGDKLVRDVYLFGRGYRLVLSRKGGKQKGSPDSIPTQHQYCGWLVGTCISLNAPIKLLAMFCMQGRKLCLRANTYVAEKQNGFNI